MEKVKVVVRYNNGRLIKGFTQDFFPNRNRFHLFSADSPSGEAIDISMNELKAIFMVRDFTGDSLYKEREKYIEGEEVSGRKMEVTFRDGELLVGSTLGYDPNRQGFLSFQQIPKATI